MDLFTCYQTRTRGRVPQASYHLVHRSSCFANTQGHVLLLVHVQFHYRDAVEVTIAIANSRIISRYLNYRYYRSTLHYIEISKKLLNLHEVPMGSNQYLV